jgi:tetratricopeptide (TPR) repeat protein
VLRQVFYAYWSAQTLELRSALATELAECAAEVQDPALQWWAHVIDFNVSVARGELARAQAALDRMQRIAEELGQPTLKWFSTFQTATWELLHGDPVAAERSAARAFAIGLEAGEPDAIFIYGIQLTAARLYSGRLPEVTEMLKKSRGAPGVPSVTAGRASILCWLDRRAEATAILKQAASDRFDHVLTGPDELVALMLYADVAVQTGDTDASSTLYERIRPFGGQIGWTGASTYGHARMYLGLLAAVLGKHDQADRHLAFACEFQETNGMPLWAAQAHLGWAEALAARGDAARAREHAVRALELSREHGYGLFEQRAAALAETQSAAETDPR